MEPKRVIQWPSSELLFDPRSMVYKIKNVDMKDVKEMDIPPSLGLIDRYTLKTAKELSKLNVLNMAKSRFIVDSNLFLNNRFTNVLVFTAKSPIGNNVSVPNSITRLYPYSFADMLILNPYFITNLNVNILSSYCFSCTQIKQLFVPNSWRIIGTYCFADSGLIEIIFTKTSQYESL